MEPWKSQGKVIEVTVLVAKIGRWKKQMQDKNVQGLFIQTGCTACVPESRAQPEPWPGWAV
jgi:hypothetical protein